MGEKKEKSIKSWRRSYAGNKRHRVSGKDTEPVGRIR